MKDNIIPADVSWSINYDRFSDVGRRWLEYELCMNLCIGWQYQLCKSPLSHGCPHSDQVSFISSLYSPQNHQLTRSGDYTAPHNGIQRGPHIL